MLPTLWGRIQTRVLVLGVLGGAWTVVLAPFLWLISSGDPTVFEVYRVAFTVLFTVIVLGVAWEFVYHFLQQFRWEKDWPILLGLLTAINEGIVVWLVVDKTGLLPAELRPSPLVFTVQFLTTWLLVWVAVNGPLRVIFPHWRFQGGRFL
ncbi:hypothetical protein GONAM_23_00110 [Gordonia namibiensis NBRC 108229]|uniref:Uncharacterized protein n=1 Tax=Gordonia namibiensis NBRC 108229 TaxID=1208314 RepID=K6XQT1_9ACTN|nr:hypothetical protein [Gordonia namibiensis]GAC01190.1 hypothetical protein GONAM_23_00110 [Gordonia namibiensis NBRC 108229]